MHAAPFYIIAIAKILINEMYRFVIMVNTQCFIIIVIIVVTWSRYGRSSVLWLSIIHRTEVFFYILYTYIYKFYSLPAAGITCYVNARGGRGPISEQHVIASLLIYIYIYIICLYIHNMYIICIYKFINLYTMKSLLANKSYHDTFSTSCV